MEAVMLKYYQQNIDKAGTGLECLPGVKQLLQALKVNNHVSLSYFMYIMPSCTHICTTAHVTGVYSAGYLQQLQST